MGRITTDQSHQVMATLAINSDWTEVDFEASGLQDLIIRNPKEAGRQFTAFLKNGGRMSIFDFPIWKTIRLGTHPDVKSLQKAIEDANMQISSQSYDIMSKPTFTLTQEKTTIELVTATVAKLGFSGNTSYDKIYARIRGLGYYLCPSEVGPQLRLRYPEQSNDECLYMAMEPITDSSDNLRIFYVKNNDYDYWLRTQHNLLNHLWSLDDCFLFVKPSK